MQGSVIEKLTTEILTMLPQGHIVMEDTHKPDANTIVVGWMNSYGTTSIAEITFDQSLLDNINNVIESQDDALLQSHLKKIEKHVVNLTAQHEAGNIQPWLLNMGIAS